MKVEIKNPIPLYRKLLLENKILLFFLSILLLLGLTVLAATYRTSTRLADDLILEQAQAVLGLYKNRFEKEIIDSNLLTNILGEVNKKNIIVSHLVYQNMKGEILAETQSPIVAKSTDQPTSNPKVPEKDLTAKGSFFLMVNNNQIGEIIFHIDPSGSKKFAGKIIMGITSAMIIPVILLLLFSWFVIRRAVHPLKHLTKVADEISTGNLDPIINFGLRVNCWEIKNCQRTDCKGYMNLTRQCWYIDGTPCEGYESRFPQKLEGCRTCEVYQLHRGDEIVQLADSLKHMTNSLKESREELTKSNDFQSRLIRNSFDGIIASDAGEVITIFNKIAQELTGYTAEKVIGKMTWKDFFEDGLEKKMDKPLTFEKERRLRGFTPREFIVRHKDGSFVDVRLAGITLYERGIHFGKVFFFQDMREIKKLKEEVIRNERLAATGQAAAGISHSIRNILDGFKGGVYIFKQGKRKDNKKKMDMGWEMIERNTETISNLVKDLLNFSKERKPEYVECDPVEFLEDVMKNSGIRLKENLVANIEIADSDEKILIDVHSFSQCLTNLLRNAAEAIPHGQKGEISLGLKFEENKALFFVKDNGHGMNERTIEKVLGGMFSTKGSKGTGLGLQVTQKIIKEHKGIFKIESTPGFGTTFLIEIPHQ